MNGHKKQSAGILADSPLLENDLALATLSTADTYLTQVYLREDPNGTVLIQEENMKKRVCVFLWSWFFFCYQDPSDYRNQTMCSWLFIDLTAGEIIHLVASTVTHIHETATISNFKCLYKTTFLRIRIPSEDLHTVAKFHLELSRFRESRCCASVSDRSPAWRSNFKVIRILVIL